MLVEELAQPLIERVTWGLRQALGFDPEFFCCRFFRFPIAKDWSSLVWLDYLMTGRGYGALAGPMRC